jgi:hypothetical protein
LKTSFWTICLSWRKSILQSVVENGVGAPRINGQGGAGLGNLRSTLRGWIVTGQVRGFRLMTTRFPNSERLQETHSGKSLYPLFESPSRAHNCHYAPCTFYIRKGMLQRFIFVNLSGAVSRARGPIRRKHLRARHLEKRVSGLEEKRGFFLEGRGPDRTKAATGLAIRKGNVLKGEQ